MSVEYTKNLVGKPIVKFDCPNCKLRLSSMLAEAGTHDKCPECGQRFKVPGQQKLQQAEEKRRLAREIKAAAKKKKSEEDKTKKIKALGGSPSPAHESSGIVVEENSEQPPEIDERWLVDPEADDDLPPSHDSRSSESQTLEAARSGNSESAVVAQLPESVVTQPVAGGAAKHLENSGPSGRPVRVTHRLSKAWWKDSVRFESVSSSRYPALMAFRNLLVLLWWIAMLCSLVGLIGCPFVLMYGGYTDHSTASRSYDREVEKYDNATIENFLNQTSQGLSAADASRLNQELGKFQYSDFPMRNRIRANNSASPEDVAGVAKAWQEWTDAKKEQINQRRPSVIMAFLMVLFLILLYWVAQIVTIIVYSILILVPPECIKLAIDIEQGVRGGKTPSSN